MHIQSRMPALYLSSLLYTINNYRLASKQYKRKISITASLLIPSPLPPLPLFLDGLVGWLFFGWAEPSRAEPTTPGKKTQDTEYK